MNYFTVALLALSLMVSIAEASERELLLSPADFHIASPKGGGDDKNDCLTPGTPCATLKRVVRLLYQDYDAGCRKIKIKIAPGYEGAGAVIAGPLAGQCFDDDLEIIGNETAVLATATAPLDRTITSSIIGLGGARFKVRGVRITTTEGPGLGSVGPGLVYGAFIDFGPVATYHIVGGTGSRTQMVGNYTISGGGNGHMNAPKGHVQINPGVIVVFITSETARVTWSTAFVVANELSLVNITWGPRTAPTSGRTVFRNAAGHECSEVYVCANGSRWAASLTSQLYTGGGASDPYWLPGSQPGWTAADSWYN